MFWNILNSIPSSWLLYAGFILSIMGTISLILSLSSKKEKGENEIMSKKLWTSGGKFLVSSAMVLVGICLFANQANQVNLGKPSSLDILRTDQVYQCIYDLRSEAVIGLMDVTTKTTLSYKAALDVSPGKLYIPKRDNNGKVILEEFQPTKNYAER